MTNVKLIAENAKKASVILSSLSEDLKNKALTNVAKALEDNTICIKEANAKDLANAQKLVDEGKLSQSVFNRLKADDNKIRDMIAGIYDVIKLEDKSKY